MRSATVCLCCLLLYAPLPACQSGESATPARTGMGGGTAGKGGTIAETRSADSAATGGNGAGGTTRTTGGASAGSSSDMPTGTGGRAAGGTITASGGVDVGTGGQAQGGSATGGRAAGGMTTGGAPSSGGARDAGVGGSAIPDAAPEGTEAADAAADVQRTDAKISTVTFRNPLNSDHGSDPFMTYHQGQYYLAATTWGKTLTMKKGATIAALKAATPTVIWQDSTAARSGNMWAPEFYLLDNGAGEQRWYHYYTAGDGSNLDTQRSHVLESTGSDPIGPYRYKAQLLNTWAIDGSILKAGGKLYFMYSAWQGSTQNVWIIAMTNPWTVTGERTLLTSPTYTWEKEGSDQVNEGPVALYHGGRTFVTYSASQCASPGYKLGMLELTGANPMAAASWRKNATPVFQAAGNAYGAGHNGFFVSPDGSEDWIVYHATTNANGSCWTDRTTRIQKFSWKDDGTPNFGSPLPITTDIPVPSGE